MLKIAIGVVIAIVVVGIVLLAVKLLAKSYEMRQNAKAAKEAEAAGVLSPEFKQPRQDESVAEAAMREVGQEQNVFATFSAVYGGQLVSARRWVFPDASMLTLMIDDDGDQYEQWHPQAATCADVFMYSAVKQGLTKRIDAEALQRIAYADKLAEENRIGAAFGSTEAAEHVPGSVLTLPFADGSVVAFSSRNNVWFVAKR